MPLSADEINQAIGQFSLPEEEEPECDKLHQEFLREFPRSRLPNLRIDDYALGRNPKSFCWWLEFGTSDLGRVGGATAYKHIVFYSKKEKQWRFKKFTSEKEAFEAARKGILRILQLAEEDKFSEIDLVPPFENQNLTREKILYLFFPEKFLNISSPEHMRAFCEMFGVGAPADATATVLNRKLLEFKQQHPTFSGWSNYRFTRFLYTQFPPQRQYWKIAPGRNAAFWEECKAGGFICIGWDKVGDLGNYDNEAGLRDAFRREYPDEPVRKAKEIWNFYNLEEGVMILANRGMTSIVGVGQVTGAYSFDEGRREFKHLVRVRWLPAAEYTIPDNHKSLVSHWFGVTVKELSREEFRALTEAVPPLQRPRWKRASPDSYDLVLEVPGNLDPVNLGHLFEAFVSTEHSAQPGINEYIRGDFAAWVKEPTGVLTSPAYVTLSNWFLSNPPYSGSTRAKAAEDLWDFLFLCRPEERLSSPSANHKLLPEDFDKWWKQLQLLQGPISTPVVGATPVAGARFAQLCTETYLPQSFFEDCERLLLTQKQLILQGAPGTGKTFVTEKLGLWWAGAAERVRTVQFHETYGYEDFVQGIKPFRDPSGKTAFQLQEGIFLRICRDARENNSQCYALVIDEINRGKPARIFGELLYLFEYRNREVTLQSGQTFGIPDNVYIIGTMNTVDKSIALVDYALRRRFAFVTLLPVRDGKSVVLRKWMEAHGIENADYIERLFVALNKVVTAKDDALVIGHSYFMFDEAVKKRNFTEEMLDFIWRYWIIPLVSEYEYELRSAQIEDKYGLSTIKQLAG